MATEVGQPATPDHWPSTQSEVPLSEEIGVTIPSATDSGEVTASMFTEVGEL
jgi:hypothetical protein